LNLKKIIELAHIKGSKLNNRGSRKG